MTIIKKIGIFAAALLLSVIGFSLIASPSLDIQRMAKPDQVILAMVEAAPVTITVRG
jgi:hypothetical protein